MRQLVLLFILIPTIVFSQKRDYKTYDRAVAYFNEGKNENAKRLIVKILDKNADWKQPNLLMARIFANEGNIKKSALFLLNVYDENNTEDIKGIEQIANLYYNNGDYINALYYFESILLFEESEQIKFLIKNCRFAIEAIKNPTDINFQNIGELINSEMSEYVNTISVDGQELLFTRRLESNGLRDQEDIFLYNIPNKTITPLPFNTTNNEGAITVSADGSMYIYTACDRVNSIGGCDLYVRQYSDENGWSQEYNLGRKVNSINWESQACFSPDGKYLYFISNRKGGLGKEDIWRSEITIEGFLKAENLGSTINTNKAEMSPFLHPDNVTLYFASEGHVGMGNHDLFVSRRITTDDLWNAPENMGFPINTHNSENSLIVASDGKTAYYTSNNSGFGQEDIFVFDLPYHVQAEAISELEKKIITQKVGEEVILKNVQFDYNSYALRISSFTELHKLVAYLHKNNSFKISIEGHTDNIGNPKENKLLSENRAKSVYDYLLAKGVNPNQLASYSGYGERKPISDNATKSGRALNRRTSFRIIR